MKKLLYFITLFIFYCLFAETDQEKYLKANSLYKNELFQDAYEELESISKKNSKVWFNMGNCLYKLGKLPQAIASYKKALKTSENYHEIEKINFNIQKVTEKLPNKSDVNNLSKSALIFFNYLALIPIFYLQLIFLFTWFLFFIFLKKIFYKKNYFGLIFFLTINLIVFSILIFKYVEQNKKIGIILDGEGMIYSGPDKNYHIIGKLNMADEVKIKHQIDNWVQVSRDGLKGWMPADSISVV